MPVHIPGPTDLDDLERQLAAVSRVAIDTEFHPEGRYRPELLLIQIQVPGGDTWILDPTVDGVLSRCGPWLAALDAWVLHAGAVDLVLLRDAFGSVPEVILDTQIAAGLISTTYPAGLARLLRRFIQVDLPKSATLSDWSRRPLTAQQVQYAADDVIHLHQLWDAIHAAVVSLGREQVLDGALQHARAEALAPPDPSDAWRNIPGAIHLDTPDASVLRSLARWREEAAQARDVPSRTVAHDGVLRTLTKSRPADRSALSNIRRLPRALSRDHADDILTAIRVGLDEASTAPPAVFPRQSPTATLCAALSLLGLAVGDADDFASRLVLPDALCEQIALAHHQGEPTPALPPWRDALIGDALRSFLSGRTSLGIETASLRLRG